MYTRYTRRRGRRPDSSARRFRPLHRGRAPRRRRCWSARSSGPACRATSRSRSAARSPRPGCCRTTSARRPRRWGTRRKRASGSIRPGCPICGGMHGRLAIARGEPSRGIAFLSKRSRQAERAHDSRAIGLAHYELGALLPPGRRHRHRPRAHRAGRVRAARGRRPPAPRDGPLAVAASRSRRKAGSTKRWRRCARRERLALMVRAGDVVATVCGNQANVAMMQHRHEQALALAERSVELQEEGGHAARSRHRARLARADLRAAGQPEARRAGAQPRARRPQPAAVHARDDGRRLRHARADPPDPRRSRGGEPRLQKAREAYGEHGRNRASGISGRCRCSKRGSRFGAAGDIAGAAHSAANVARSRETPPAYALAGRADRRSKRCSRPDRVDEAQPAARSCRRRSSARQR